MYPLMAYTQSHERAKTEKIAPIIYCRLKYLVGMLNLRASSLEVQTIQGNYLPLLEDLRQKLNLWSLALDLPTS